MEIIDAHAHIYPVKIAEKATEAIGDFYNLNMELKSGTPENLLIEGGKIGVSKYIVHSCATKASQVRPINEFILNETKNHKEFIGFMTLHQDLTEEETYDEIKWCIKNGFKGIKLHPDFQKFYIDGENVQKIYRALTELKSDFPILFHTGDNRYEYSAPMRMAETAKKYKKVKFIAAHFGGYRRWDEYECYKGLKNVFFDTSSSLAFLPPDKAVKIMETLGKEKFFFGVDFPMWTAEGELKRFFELKLTEKERENILAKNVKNLLKIK